MATNRCCRNIIIDNLLGIIPVDSCPPIIQTVADINDAVAGTVVGQLTIARWADGSKYHIHLYEWDGADWVLVIDTTTGGSLTEFDSLEIESIVSPWQITVDQGAVWTDSTVTFDPVVTSIEVWYRNTTSGCVYTNVPIIPLVVEYCVEVYEVDVSDPFFFFGTINGIQADDIANVAATYADWEGNLTSRTNVALYGTSPGSIVIMRDSLTPAFSNLGTYVPFGGGDPVVWAPSTINCTTNCYQAVFTAADLSTEGLTAISAFSGVDYYDWGTIVPFDDPTAAAQNLDGLISAGFLEPGATLSYSFNGLEVTVGICSIKPMHQFSWGTNIADQGTANFTQL